MGRFQGGESGIHRQHVLFLQNAATIDDITEFK